MPIEWLHEQLTHEPRIVSQEEISNTYKYVDPFRKWAYQEVAPGVSTTTLLTLMFLDIESGLRTWMTSEIVKFLKYPLRVDMTHVNSIRDKLENPSCKLSTSFSPDGEVGGGHAGRSESIRMEKRDGKYHLLHVIHHFDQITKEENYAARESHVLQTAVVTDKDKKWSKSAFVDMLSRYVYHGGALCYGEEDYLLEYLV